MKRILAILLAVALVLGLTLTSSLPALGEDDTTPPSVAMVSPPSGYALQGGITFVASATDSESGVNSVDLLDPRGQWWRRDTHWL